MWQSLTIFFSGGMFGTVFGIALGFFTFPYVFPPPEAMETPVAEARGEPLARGTFIHANTSDPIHYGKGSVRVFDRVVYLDKDFEVGPGPAFHVYLAPKPEIRRSSDVAGSMYVDLGKLRAFKGSQNYKIPAGVDLGDFPSVVIWCAQFGVLISPADLNFGS